MSLQRAVVNCRACYNLFHACQRSLVNEKLNYIRNEAMKAIEDTILHHAYFVTGINSLGNSELGDVLSACQDCDYSNPRIADMLTKKSAGAKK